MDPITTNTIQTMRQEGRSNNDIIRSLQQQGYKSAQIFDALNQASIQPSRPGMSQENPFTTPSPAPKAQAEQQVLNNQGPASNLMSPNPQPPSNTAPPLQGMPRPMGGSQGVYGQEELIEAIIDEKWNDLLEDVNKIIAWKERTTQRIDQMDQQMKDLKEQFDRLHQAVIGKVGEYDQHILQVGAEVKAMEKVFSKVLPAFTENVGELSRIADSMKKNTKQKQ